MITTGIKDLKNKPSRYLSYVKDGEEVLVRQGLVTLPTEKIEKDIPDSMDISGKPVSEMAIEDRR